MRASRLSRSLDELDLVAVGILDEGDHRGAALHRSRLARHFPAVGPDLVAGLLHIGHADRDVTEGVAELVALDTVVVGELENGGALLVLVAAEGERILLLGPLGGAP